MRILLVSLILAAGAVAYAQVSGQATITVTNPSNGSILAGCTVLSNNTGTANCSASPNFTKAAGTGPWHVAIMDSFDTGSYSNSNESQLPGQGGPVSIGGGQTIGMISNKRPHTGVNSIWNIYNLPAGHQSGWDGLHVNGGAGLFPGTHFYASFWIYQDANWRYDTDWMYMTLTSTGGWNLQFDMQNSAQNSSNCVGGSPSTGFWACFSANMTFFTNGQNPNIATCPHITTPQGSFTTCTQDNPSPGKQFAPPLAQWYQVEWEVKESTCGGSGNQVPANDGFYTIWINGQLLTQDTSGRANNSSTNPFFYMWNCGTGPQTDPEIDLMSTTTSFHGTPNGAANVYLDDAIIMYQ